VLGIVTGTFYNVMVTANYSLISAMCAYPDEESLLSSNRMTGSNAGRMIAGYLVPVVVVALLPALKNTTYILISILCSAFMLATYMIHFKISAGFEGNGQVGSIGGERLTIKEMAAAVAATPQIIVLVLADVNSTVNAFLLPGLMIYMYQYVILDGTVMPLMAIHNLAIGLLGTMGAFSARWLMKRIPDRRKVCYLLYPLISVSIFCSRFFVNAPFMFITMCALMQYFLGMSQPVEGTLYFDLAVIAQAKMGKDPTATFMGLSQFAPRLSGILRGLVMSALFISLNYDPTQPVTQTLKDGFINAFSIVSAIIPIVGWLALLIFYRITPERVEKARQEILARNNAPAPGE
jgi:Na+/melibiose symporter-like transporter